MAKEALSELSPNVDEILRSIFPEVEREWQCPHCEMEVLLTKDRVTDCIIEHPAIIVRETQYWRCPACNAVASQESLDYVEPIEYIQSST